MYFLFRYKGWEPSKFYNMLYGEKIIIRAFVRKEAKERKKMVDMYNGMD